MKKILLLVCVLAVAFALTACGGGNDAATDNEGAGNNTEVVNPMTEYASIDELNQAVGFDMVMLTDENIYQVVEYATIADEVAQITYQDIEAAAPEETEITVRMSKGTDDISGMYGVNYTQEDLDGVTVNKGVLDDYQVAWFTYDVYAYSVTAKGIDEATFENIVKDIIAQAGVEL